jgi:hypothetical protein
MCYEQRRTSRARAEAREEGRRVWDLFHRDTEAEPPRPVTEPEWAREGEEAVKAEPEREPTPR